MRGRQDRKRRAAPLVLAGLAARSGLSLRSCSLDPGTLSSQRSAACAHRFIVVVPWAVQTRHCTKAG